MFEKLNNFFVDWVQLPLFGILTIPLQIAERLRPKSNARWMPPMTLK